MEGAYIASLHAASRSSTPNAKETGRNSESKNRRRHYRGESLSQKAKSILFKGKGSLFHSPTPRVSNIGVEQLPQNLEVWFPHPDSLQSHTIDPAKQSFDACSTSANDRSNSLTSDSTLSSLSSTPYWYCKTLPPPPLPSKSLRDPLGTLRTETEPANSSTVPRLYVATPQENDMHTEVSSTGAGDLAIDYGWDSVLASFPRPPTSSGISDESSGNSNIEPSRQSSFLELNMILQSASEPTTTQEGRYSKRGAVSPPSHRDLRPRPTSQHLQQPRSHRTHPTGQAAIPALPTSGWRNHSRSNSTNSLTRRDSLLKRGWI